MVLDIMKGRITFLRPHPGPFFVDSTCRELILESVSGSGEVPCERSSFLTIIRYKK